MARNERGFTLFELMVSTTIVAVLAATSLPSYRLAILRAKYAQMGVLMRTVRTAMELGMAEMEDMRDISAYFDSLNWGYAETVYVIVNREGSTSPAILDKLAPGISPKMFKDPNTHIYAEWGSGCAEEQWSNSSCMLWMSYVVNCKYNLVWGLIDWHDNQAFIPGQAGYTTGANKDIVVTYQFSFNPGDPTYGCDGDHLSVSVVGEALDLTPDGDLADISDVKAVDGGPKDDVAADAPAK